MPVMEGARCLCTASFCNYPLFAPHWSDESADAASKGRLCVSAVTLAGLVTLTFLSSVFHPVLPIRRRRRLLAEWTPIKAAAMQTTAWTPLPTVVLTQAAAIRLALNQSHFRFVLFGSFEGLKKDFEVEAFSLTCTLMLDQVGPGSISVVSPPAPHYHATQVPFAGASGGPQQYEDAPPDYSEGFANSAFSDGAMRRGEQGLQHGSMRAEGLETLPFLCFHL